VIVVGETLATKVARQLEAGNILAYNHRDYCGVGLRFADGIYVYGAVYDGYLPTAIEAKDYDSSSNEERRHFHSRESFVAWLAIQSDVSLSGTELSNSWLWYNQRLIIARLTEFVAG
jgi:hypothetical protein